MYFLLTPADADAFVYITTEKDHNRHEWEEIQQKPIWLWGYIFIFNDWVVPSEVDPCGGIHVDTVDVETRCSEQETFIGDMSP